MIPHDEVRINQPHRICDTPPELLELHEAWICGVSYHRKGMPRKANPFVSLDRSTLQSAWAWEFGWREREHLVRAAAAMQQ